eukprot:scaffold2782_cov182-Amphora_coffeaeformis.AAC.5
MSTVAADVDVTSLRQALRLVHCLQKERGASCSYHASKSLFSKRNAVEPARHDTDRALRKASMCMNSHNARAVLEKIRKATESEGVSYHRILATYNCLVSAIVHDGIWKYTNQKKDDDDSTVKHENGQIRRRVPSHQDLMDLHASADKKKQHRRLRSENFRGRVSTDPTDFSFLNTDGEFNCAQLESLRGRVTSAPTDMAVENTDGDFPCVIAPPPPAIAVNGNKKPLARIDSVGSEADQIEESNPQISVDISENDSDNATNISRLLTLLGTFVALTESVGVERATVCSIIAAGPESHDLLNVRSLRFDVGWLCYGEFMQEICQEYSHSFISLPGHGTRSRKPTTTYAEAFEEQMWLAYSFSQRFMYHVAAVGRVAAAPTCRKFQWVDGTGFRLGQTMGYADELEYALESSTMENEQDTVHWSAVFGKYDRIEKLKDIVESTPPDDVKGKVIAALRNEISKNFQILEEHLVNEDQDDANRENSEDNRLDSMLKELSSAPQSKEWEIDLYQIRFKKRIGQGAAGTTYLADWGGTRVAVKVASITEMGLDGWRTEVQALQKLHHPNIIRLMGSVYHPNPLTFCLVLEYCDAGDLDTAMQRVTPRNFVSHVAISMAKGMAYLHKRGIIHRDIKPMNILLSGNVSGGYFEVKVTDFGVATESTQGGLRTAETGTYRWMAPEVIRHEAYSETADVFSFGVVLWQLTTRELPYEDKSTFEAAAAVAMESLRPPFPDRIPTAYKKLVEDCWQGDPGKRPHFEDIVDVLNDMEKTKSEEEISWFEAPLGHPAYRKAKERKPAKEKSQKPAAPELQLQTPEIEPGNYQHKKGKAQKTGRLKSLFARKSSYF